MSTTLRDVTHDETPRPSPSSTGRGAAPSRRDGVVRWLGDLAALAPVMVALVWLAGLDGGRGLVGTWPLAVAAGVALPAVLGELRRLPRVATAVLAAWLVGLLLGTAAAVHREHMVVPLLQYTIAPVLVLATRRLWRRSWAPGVLLLALVLAFGRYQERAWSIWWARTAGGEGLWQTISWRNQSAALTGMFGAWFLGAALASTRLVRGGLVLLAASGFAGAWLSSSRAGLAVTVGAAVVATVLGWRSAVRRGESRWRPGVAVAGAVAVTVALVGALLAMQPTGTAQPLAGRDQSVSQNTSARIEHVEAAVGMFADRPLAGQGLGSYREMMREWNPPDGILTGSAHNEYAEVAAEAGVLALVALLAVAAGAALLGLRLLRDTPTADRPDDLRAPLVVGGVGALALFVVHSAVDFDWNYPVLSALAAIALALMLPERPRHATGRTATVAVAGLLATLLGAGLVMGGIERWAGPAPWNVAATVRDGEEALEDGEPAEALALAEDALAWSPAAPEAASLRARARYALDGDVASLARTAREDERWFAGRVRAAAALAEAGDVERATDLLAALQEDLDDFRAWGVSATRLEAVEVAVGIAAGDSCEDAREVVADALAADQADVDRGLPSDAEEVLGERLVEVGCG